MLALALPPHSSYDQECVRVGMRGDPGRRAVLPNGLHLKWGDGFRGFVKVLFSNVESRGIRSTEIDIRLADERGGEKRPLTSFDQPHYDRY